MKEVKILQSCHFNICGINHRCFRKMPIKKNNEEPWLLKRLSFLLLIVDMHLWIYSNLLKKALMENFNHFVPNALFHLKTSENLTVFWCFQVVEKGCIEKEWVNFSTVEAKNIYISQILLMTLSRKIFPLIEMDRETIINIKANIKKTKNQENWSQLIV